MGVFQLRFWHVDVGVTVPVLTIHADFIQVLHHGQRRRQAGASHRHIEPAWGAIRVRHNIAQCDTHITDGL